MVGGLEEERRDLVPDAGAEVVLVVVGSVPEQEHVAGSRRGPEVEGVGEEVADGLGRGLSEPELVEDVLDGDGGARQALAAAELEEGLGGLEEGPGREDEVVVAVAGVLEPAGRSELDRGPEGSLGGEIAMAGLGAEAAAPGRALIPVSQRGEGSVRSSRIGVASKPLSSAVPVSGKLPSSTPASATVELG